MKLDQLEKLKLLIQASPVLDQAEREEWLALLQIMNDKQLLELQKILEEAKNQGSGSRKQEAGGSRKVQQQEPGKERGAAAKPSFSHIMNLPHPEKAEALPASQKQPSLARPPLVKTTEPAFLQKMKNIFAEKELPPGHPNAIDELELPAPASKSGDREAPALPLKPVQASAAAKPEALAQKQPPAPSAWGPKLPPAKPVGYTPPDKEQPNLAAAKAAVPPAKPKFAAPQPELEHVSPGIAVPSVSEKAKNELLDSIKKASVPSFDHSSSHQPSPLARNAILLKPEEAANLEAADLNMIKPEALLRRLRELVEKFGYHEVVSHLERSPLYKDYLTTGTKLLSEQASFEDMEKPGQKGVLSREEFEFVADLLRQIQAS